MIAKEVALLLMKLHINERQWLCFFFCVLVPVDKGCGGSSTSPAVIKSKYFPFNDQLVPCGTMSNTELKEAQVSLGASETISR